jgi:hypothetical protein
VKERGNEEGRKLRGKKGGNWEEERKAESKEGSSEGTWGK